MAIPTGAVRFNTDSSKMEVYIGSTWMEVAVTESAPIGGRMLVQQGNVSPRTSIDYLNMTTEGNAIDFGDMTVIATYSGGSSSSPTRMCVYDASSPSVKSIEKIEIVKKIM